MCLWVGVKITHCLKVELCSEHVPTLCHWPITIRCLWWLVNDTVYTHTYTYAHTTHFSSTSNAQTIHTHGMGLLLHGPYPIAVQRPGPLSVTQGNWIQVLAKFLEPGKVLEEPLPASLVDCGCGHPKSHLDLCALNCKVNNLLATQKLHNNTSTYWLITI